jgi:hypothetical protein
MQLQEIVIATFVVEIIEVMLQSSNSLKNSIAKIYSYYQKSPFIFFLTNIGYIWLLFIAVGYGVLNTPIALALSLKTVDIFTKMHLMQRLFLKPDSNYISEFSQMLESKTPIWMWLVGPLTYPYIVYIALS